MNIGCTQTLARRHLSLLAAEAEEVDGVSRRKAAEPVKSAIQPRGLCLVVCRISVRRELALEEYAADVRCDLSEGHV